MSNIKPQCMSIKIFSFAMTRNKFPGTFDQMSCTRTLSVYWKRKSLNTSLLHRYRGGPWVTNFVLATLPSLMSSLENSCYNDSCSSMIKKVIIENSLFSESLLNSSEYTNDLLKWFSAFFRISCSLQVQQMSTSFKHGWNIKYKKAILTRDVIAVFMKRWHSKYIFMA